MSKPIEQSIKNTVGQADRGTNKDIHGEVAAIQEALLEWYRVHQRDLPWRRTKDPYAIWISEIMLQQTQVGTVVPYYHRFLEKFPDVRSLARADLETVLKLWEGLGYYSRARNIYTAARKVMTDFGGIIPSSVENLRKLPGIGRYTAGAIASIAFGLDEPVLDGNVERVLCRVFYIKENPKETRTHQRLWSLAQMLIPDGRASFFNQAMMDLGATICVPRNPRCPVCPLSKLCEAFRRDKQNTLPVRVKRKPVPHYQVAAGVIWKGGHILIDRRKPEGLLGGLWEFPGGKCEAGETLEGCLAREVREELGIRIKVGEKITAVDHAYTHFRITLHVFECLYLSGRPRAIGCAAWKWIRPGQLKEYPLPKANHKVIAVLSRLSL